MQRVMIVGISGAGKSTLSRAISTKFNIPAFHLDNIFHSAGWIARPVEDVQKDFDAIAAMDAWVVDGNFRKLSAALRDRADVIVFLDFGRMFALHQVISRWAKHKLCIQKRKDLGEGFTEQLPFSFLKWVWNWRHDNRPNWVADLANYKTKTKTFTSRRQVNAWLKAL